MNTCLNNLYLKVAKIDARYVRLAFMVFALVAGGVILGPLPVHGEVGI